MASLLGWDKMDKEEERVRLETRGDERVRL